MNTETQLPAPVPPTQTPNPAPSLCPKYRRNGNVARCPKAHRDKINLMIQDGLSYAAIVRSLGDERKGLTASSLSRWRKGGYQDWLAEQAFISRTRARQETPAELVRDFDGTEVNHAALQLGTLHIFEALRDLGPGSLNEKLGGDCTAFARLLNALARASRETMLLQKYREACARARAALEPMKDPNRKLSDNERHAIIHHVDQILGLNEAPILAPDAEPNPALGIITLHHPADPAATTTSEGRAPASPHSPEPNPATGEQPPGEPSSPPNGETLPTASPQPLPPPLPDPGSVF